ncbi:MAG: NAD(P)/FAD-dependent oxidoreductase [Chloroflexota bacterium]
MTDKYFDVIIVGAGISGIGTAVHLQEQCPDKSYAILEGRSCLGGTWDLFRYPGIRSDSNMLTMAYRFKPWRGTNTTADGASILNYLRETAVEYNINQHIRYNQHVTQASWSSTLKSWTIQTKAGEYFTCSFLLLCSGYYSYEAGYTPDFKGRAQFQGTIIHPQKWPKGFDYADKKIVVVGSGATAVTLIPELAKKAQHVTMLQRSATYMSPLPSEDALGKFVRKYLPEKLAYALLRQRSIFFGQFFYRQTRKNPEKVKERMLSMVREELPPDYDIDTHFTPTYNPWDQRVCLVPDGDLFQAIRDGTASVVTSHIDQFIENGILLKSGEELEADVIITATGLKLEVMGGIKFIVDNEPIDFAKTISYKGLMFSTIPNLVYTFGYINASWTLGADLTAEFICNLINHMAQTGTKQCTPTYPESAPEAVEPWIQNFSSGYMQRSLHLLPKQTTTAPWINTQDYDQDKKMIGRAPIENQALIFT